MVGTPLTGWSAVSVQVNLPYRKLKSQVELVLEIFDTDEEVSFSVEGGKLIVFNLPRFKYLLNLVETGKGGVGLTLSDFCQAFEIRPSTVKSLIYDAINNPSTALLKKSVDFFASKNGWRIVDPQNFLNKVIYGNGN